MNREDSIFWAKRCLVDSIWKEAHIEGIDVTFPETQEIVEGRTVAGMSVDHLMAINNLKHAWGFVFDTLDQPLDLAWAQRLNLKIGEGGVVSYAGDLREKGVMIGGTAWRPEVPDAGRAEAELAAMATIRDPEERALRTFGFLCRSQLFNDGNKRTGQLAANKVLIEGGAGVLSVPIDKKLEFGEKLIGFYESADSGPLDDFLRRCCIENPELGA